MTKIKDKIQNILKKIILKHKASSESYIEHLRKNGMRIGERTTIFNPNHTAIDETRPWMIEIGNDVQITKGVTILTHGFDWSVLKGVYGEVLGSSGKVTIGNNVFIGTNALILKGVSIGNNVIIGAGSVVTRSIPDNCVAAGNPAKVIMTLEEYHQKRIDAQLKEATELVHEYRKVYGRNPDSYALSEYFWLFTDDPCGIHWSWEYQMKNAGNQDFSNEKLRNNKKQFENMKDFLDRC